MEITQGKSSSRAEPRLNAPETLFTLISGSTSNTVSSGSVFVGLQWSGMGPAAFGCKACRPDFMTSICVQHAQAKPSLTATTLGV